MSHLFILCPIYYLPFIYPISHLFILCPIYLSYLPFIYPMSYKWTEPLSFALKRIDMDLNIRCSAPPVWTKIQQNDGFNFFLNNFLDSYIFFFLWKYRLNLTNTYMIWIYKTKVWDNSNLNNEFMQFKEIFFFSLLI